jgi:hypothetical protein
VINFQVVGVYHQPGPAADAPVPVGSEDDTAQAGADPRGSLFFSRAPLTVPLAPVSGDAPGSQQCRQEVQACQQERRDHEQPGGGHGAQPGPAERLVQVVPAPQRQSECRAERDDVADVITAVPAVLA